MQIFERTGLKPFALLLGVLFFAASLTPSLIPRDWLAQGALAGLVMALGYMIGRTAMGLWWLMELPKIKYRTALILYCLIGIPTIIVFIICLVKALAWQNGIRELMGMELLSSSHTIKMIVVAMLVFIVLFGIGFLLRTLYDNIRQWLDIYMPKRTANLAGFILTITLVLIITRDGVLDNVVASLDKSYTVTQRLFDTAPLAPSNSNTSGGPNSLIDWGAVGQPGRNYILTGPTQEEIANFTKRSALQPIRVYAGLAQADTPEERADVALAELKRQGGFDRKVLIVALPTGTGWLDPGAMDTVEYMHGGDIATIAVQYSYLQSPLALILETRAGLDQARTLITKVHSYWRSLPKDNRPRLYIHGLSLGAWASMYGTDLFALLDDPINGALWAGPPFPSTTWKNIVAERNPDSAYVLPKLGTGRLVRFSTHNQGPGGVEGWGDIRIVFLQYTSDPIVFYEPASFFRAPEWMNEATAVDVSPDIQFIPVVTQFQLLVDMLLANTAPAGYGHAYYGPDYIKPWIAVTAPEGWTDMDTQRLLEQCDNGVKIGCRK